MPKASKQGKVIRGTESHEIESKIILTYSVAQWWFYVVAIITVGVCTIRVF